MEEETGLSYENEKRRLSEELHHIIEDIQRGDVSTALVYAPHTEAS